MDEIKEVARYLGYKAKSDIAQISPMIKECLDQLKSTSKYKTIYKIFDLIGDDVKKVKEIDIVLPGRSIINHLKNSERIVFMSATLGIGVDKRIKYLQYKDLAKSIVYDACASTYIEQICDQLEENIMSEVGQKVEKTTRFSPGYGDLPLSFQKIMDSVLRLDKTIGVTVNKNNILIPRKSVTALFGLGSKNNISPCYYCNVECPEKNKCLRGGLN